MSPDGILTREHALGESRAHDDDGLLGLRIEVVEIAAGEDGNA